MLFGASAAAVSQTITSPLYAVLTRQAVQGASTVWRYCCCTVQHALQAPLQKQFSFDYEN
jgi:hypothetical protein